MISVVSKLLVHKTRGIALKHFVSIIDDIFSFSCTSWLTPVRESSAPSQGDDPGSIADGANETIQLLPD